jgi:hypothetical protein
MASQNVPWRHALQRKLTRHADANSAAGPANGLTNARARGAISGLAYNVEFDVQALIRPQLLDVQWGPTLRAEVRSGF